MGNSNVRLLLLIVLLAVAGGAAWWFSKPESEPATPTQPRPRPLSTHLLVDPRSETQPFEQSQPYRSPDQVLQIDLPSFDLESSGEQWREFLRNTGWKLELSAATDEEKTLQQLREGRTGAAILSRSSLARFTETARPVVAAEVDYHRGAIGLLTRSKVSNLQDLCGKIVVAAPGATETFIRQLAEFAGTPVSRLTNWPPATPLNPDEIHLLLAVSPSIATRFFQERLEAEDDRMAGCVALLSPAGKSLMKPSGGTTHLLLTDRNLLLNPRVLAFNPGFAQDHPELVKAFAEALPPVEDGAPIRSPTRVLSPEPLLVRWLPLDFPPNRAAPARDYPELFEQIAGILQRAPGSTIRLRGYVDGRLSDRFRTEGEASEWEQRALAAMDLGEQRAEWVRQRLIAAGADGGRIETEGRGWLDAEGNRGAGIELQWFVLD